MSCLRTSESIFPIKAGKLLISVVDRIDTLHRQAERLACFLLACIVSINSFLNAAAYAGHGVVFLPQIPQIPHSVSGITAGTLFGAFMLV